VTDDREDDAAGGDLCEVESLDAVGSEDHVQIGTGERAHPVLGDDDVARLRRDGRVNLATG
jgi:hypothetical protein